jgi:hypothetical protein
MSHTGACPTAVAGCRCAEEEDFDGNGVINIDDLLIVIGAFEPC